MSQPIPVVTPHPDPSRVLAALRVERRELPIERYENGHRHLYVALPTEAAVAALAPDFGALARAAAEEPRFLAANCFAGAGGR